MHQDDACAQQWSAGTRAIDRRTIAKGVAWSVPVVIVATAAPAAATSNPVLPTAVTLVPGKSGNITIALDSGSPNPDVKITGVTGGGVTWSSVDGVAQRAVSTDSKGCNLTFTLAQNSNGVLNGVVTVTFTLSTGSAWKVLFTYAGTKDAQTASPTLG